MRRSSIIVLGSINTDLVIRGPRLPQPGETVLGGEFYQAAGGKGANQAVAAARLAREPVTFIAATGDDPLGEAARHRLRRENLICDYVKAVTQQPTGVALILVDERGQNAISVASGANHHLSPQDVEMIPAAVFDSARVLLTSLESPFETVATALRRAKEHGLMTILNPAPATREIADGSVLQLVDVLTPNEGEAATLAAWTQSGHVDAATVIQRLHALGCHRVVLTRGERGCLIAAEELFSIPARPVEAVDATGAGDAFNGALAVALAEGRPLRESAEWANCAAALAVTRRGAQPSLPTRAQVDHQCDS